MPDRNDRHGAGASADALKILRHGQRGYTMRVCGGCGSSYYYIDECEVEGRPVCEMCCSIWELLMTHGAGLPLGKPRLFLPGIDSTRNRCCPAWIDAVSFANASLRE